MKRLTILIAAILLCMFVIVPIARQILSTDQNSVPDTGTAILEGGAILVRGPQNTLSTISQQINEPTIFSYDAKRKLALCRGNIIVEGELTIGQPDAEGLTETLEFNTKICGDCMLLVRPGGLLQVHNAEISTKNRMIVHGLCPMGYGIIGQGRLVMKNVRLLYMSGSVSKMFSGREASGLLDTVVSQGGETNTFSYDGIDGSKVTITNSSFIGGSGTSGAWAGFTFNEPVIISNSTMIAKGSDIVIEEGANLILIDCKFRPNKLNFTGRKAKVDIRRKKTFRVVDAQGHPVSGATVTAQSMKDAAHPFSVTAETDENGLAALTLREYIAERNSHIRKDGVNNSAPYTVTATHAGLACSVDNVDIRTVSDDTTITELALE